MNSGLGENLHRNANAHLLRNWSIPYYCFEAGILKLEQNKSVRYEFTFKTNPPQIDM